MSVKTSTVYTKERLLRFSNFALSAKKHFWIIMAIFSLICIAMFIFSAVMGILSDTVVMCTVVILLLDILWVFMTFIFPRLTVNKAKNLNASVEYTFGPESIHIKSEGNLFSEESTLKYNFLSKVMRNGNDVYIFFNANQAYVVDISSLSSEEIDTIKGYLSQSIPKKKIKW